MTESAGAESAGAGGAGAEGAGARGGVPGGVPESAVPQVLADVRELTGRTSATESSSVPASVSVSVSVSASASTSAGALWKLAESGRQLDANVVHLPPGRGVDPHAEPLLDVLLLVVGGDGTLATADGPRHLTEGTLLWLPHGSRRGLTAGEHGLYYLTVHRRRPGMQIGRRTPETATDTAAPASAEAAPASADDAPAAGNDAAPTPAREGGAGAGGRPTALVKARMLFTDSRGRVLLVRLQPSEGGHPWGLPGGTVETVSETPRAAAARETAEELGLTRAPGRLLSVDWVTRPDDRPRVVHVFDGGRLEDEQLACIRLDEDELAEWRMCPPGEAEALLTGAGWGQVKESLAVLASGSGPAELVDGVPPGV